MKRDLLAHLDNRCPRCKKGVLVTDGSTGEILCSACGCVVTEGTEQRGPEWSSFSAEQYQRESRTGMGTSLAIHDRGLSTIIDPKDRDATGKPLSGEMKRTVGRLRLWDSRNKVQSRVEMNYRQAFSELQRLKEKLALGDAVVEKAAYIYRKAVEKRLAKGGWVGRQRCAKSETCPQVCMKNPGSSHLSYTIDS